jgi:hypothetical protein
MPFTPVAGVDEDSPRVVPQDFTVAADRRRRELIMSLTNRSVSGLASTAVAGVLLAVVGCQRGVGGGNIASTPAEQMQARAAALEQKAALVKRGQNLVVDGQGEVARGQALVDLGRDMEGQQAIIAGEAKIREGNLYISRANNLQLPDAPGALPSDNRPYASGQGNSGNRGMAEDRGQFGREPTVGADTGEIDRNPPISDRP